MKSENDLTPSESEGDMMDEYPSSINPAVVPKTPDTVFAVTIMSPYIYL
ncbi:hypothetical protein [Phytobacter sp. AG2a]|jgi:hypothetical protein